jgi:conjugal transfer/entry exclusion protein
MPKRLIPSLLVLALVLVLLLWPAWSFAQLPVTDAGNLAVNSTTSLQSTISAIEAVFQSVEWVTDLTPLDGIGVAGGIMEDMAALGMLVEQAEGLSYDLGSLQSQIVALFHLDTPPDTTMGLEERLADIRRVRYQSYSYAMRVQTLLTTASRTVEHLTGLLDTLGGVIGNVTGHQTNGQFQGVIGKHVANLDVQIASFNRAQSVDKMEELLTIESLRAINVHVWDR